MSLFSHVLRSTSCARIGVPKKSAKRNGSWKRPKSADKKLPAPDLLEYRQTVSDTFFVALQAAGASLLGNAVAAEKSRDPFGLTNTQDISVSGGSDNRYAAAGGAVPQRIASVSLLGEPSTEATRVSGVSVADRAEFASGRFSESQKIENAGSSQDDDLPVVLDSPAVDNVAPRPHGIIRKLQLAPPAFAVGASNTFVADTASPLQAGTPFEIPHPAEPPAAAESVPAAPPRPNIPAGAGDNTNSPTNRTLTDGTAQTATSVATDSIRENTTASLSPADRGRGQGEGEVADLAASGGGTTPDRISSPNGGGPTIVSAGAPPCVPSTPPNQSGGGPPVVPPGPPCTPPGQQTSSPPDPLYVLNWESNHGLVAFPGVVEFDKDGQWVELRANVYGATVSSWSWDTSQAGRAGCISGSSTYKLRFRWQNYNPGESTNTITVTATMTDSSTQSATLTFKVPTGGGGTCPSTPASATWPAVLTPDKPAESQDLLVSDSATRPYAVSQESGVLYVTHDLPAYQPGSGSSSAMHMPALGLTYSSIAAERRPIFINRYELDPSASVPETVSARLKFNGTWGSSKYYNTSPSSAKWNPGDIMQISLQADAGSLATGRYSYDFETTANYSGGSSTTTTSSGTVTIINEESSVFGEGWTLDILDRVHSVTGGVILNQGAGNSLWFAESGTSGGNTTYTTPAGDFSTLLKNNTTGVYTRTLKTGVQQIFNSSGYQTSLVDLNSNRVTFTYDGSNNLSTITDPNNLVTTFGYSSGKVSTITDPANRITTFSYSSGRLESIKDPDNAISTFTYDSSSGRMLTAVDPRSNTTSFTYNFAGRATTVTRPDSTTEQYMALQLQSLCDGGQCTQGSPGTAVLAAEAVSDYTDPRSNAWDYRMDWNGFGQTTQMTDPLGQTTPAGHMTVYHRDANGLVLQATDRLDRNTAFEYDSKANVTKMTWPDGNSQLLEYNSNSQLTKKTDELSRVTTFTYDGEGNLTQITKPDPDGGGPLTSPITTFAYTADGFVETMVDARNKTTSFSYTDGRDRINQITYPDDDGVSTNNPKVTFTYDSASNVETRVDERSNTTTYFYDAMNRVKTLTTPDRDGAGGLPAPITSYSYDNAGNLTQLKRPDPDGTGSLSSPITTFTYNSMNRLETTVDGLSNTTTFLYDNAGNVQTVTDPLSRTTTFTYNELGQHTVTKEPDPDGGGSLTSPITTFTYSAESELLTVKDPLSRTTTFTYQDRGWLRTQTDPLSHTTTFSYDAVGNLTAEFDALSPPDAHGNYAYDALDRVISFTDALGHITSYTYDANSNRTTVTDPLSHTTTFAYDARNRLSTVTQPDPDGGGSQTSAVTTFSYDLAGNRTGLTDPLSRVTTYAFDSGNRMTSITQPDPDGGGSLATPITTFSYDNLDRLISLKDPVNNLTTWTYDAVDQVLTEIDPLSKTTTYSYDAAGQLTRIVDRKAQRRDFGYDNLGRRTQEYWCPSGSGSASGCGTSTPTRIFTYSYDSASQLTEVNETDSRYTFTYDDGGRMTGMSTLSSNMPQVRLSNTYNEANLRMSISDNLSSAGTISFTYDDAYRMTNAAMIVGSSFGPSVAFGYDNADRLTSLSRSIPVCETCTPDDTRVRTTFSYDNADRLTALTHTYFNGSTEATLATYTYGYDAASELTSEVNQDGTYTYTYDNTSQLTGVDASGGTCGATGCDENFSYDVNGNRTMSGYSTGTDNRLTSDGTYSYTYDDNGNTLTKTRISDGQKYEFAWDYRARLTQVLLKNSGGTVLQQSDYTYDAFDRRIINSFDDDGSGSHNATVTKTTYDSAASFANAYADFDGNNSLAIRYLYSPSVDYILARRGPSGTAAWYVGDAVGSVRDVTTTSGTIVDHINYSAFGNTTSESNSSNGDRFRFASWVFDAASSLYDQSGRQFDSASARFISENKRDFSLAGTNDFLFGGNNPRISFLPYTGDGWIALLPPDTGSGQNFFVGGDGDPVQRFLDRKQKNGPLQPGKIPVDSSPNGKSQSKMFEPATGFAEGGSALVAGMGGVQGIRNAAGSAGVGSAASRDLGVPGKDFKPKPDVSGPYKRPSGAGPTAAQRASVQGKPCAACGKMTPRQVADHKDPLVVQHFREGKVNVEEQSAVEAVQPHCPSCSASQGGKLSAFARAMREFFGF